MAFFSSTTGMYAGTRILLFDPFQVFFLQECLALEPLGEPWLWSYTVI